MILTHSQKVLDNAASDIKKRILRDEEGAPRRIKPLLTYIHEHLFDPSLDVNQLKRGCGVRDNSLPIQFHAAIGKPPHAYIEDCRLTVACGLLASSDLKVWKIAQLLGYSSIQVFSRAFTRWGGVRPTTYRKHRVLAPERQSAEVTKAGARGAEARDADFLRRALKGQLEASQARNLIEQLTRLYPVEQGGF